MIFDVAASSFVLCAMLCSGVSSELTIHSDPYTIIVKPGPSQEESPQVVIKSRDTVKTIFLEFPIVFPRHAFVNDHLATITGKLFDDTTDFLSIVDIEKGVLIDTIHGFYLASSSDGKRFAFQKFQPRYGPATHFEIQVVDIDRLTTRPRTIYPEDTENSIDGDNHGLLSPMLWSEDDTKLVFFDGTKNNGERTVTFVVVDLHQAAPHAKTILFDLNSILRPGASLIDAGFAVKSLKWKDPDILTVTLLELNGWKSEEFFMNLQGQVISSVGVAKGAKGR